MPRLNRRSLLGSALAALAAGPAAAQTSWVERLSALTAQANQGTVGIMAGGVDGTYIRIAADLMNVLDEGDRMRVIAMLGRGSVQNLRDIVLLRGIDIGIVQSDVLAFARREQLLPGIDRLVQYITKLYDEEIHLLAREDVRSVRDLAGRIVNVDVRGSGTAMTSSLVLEALGVNAQIAHDPQDVALTRLPNGEIGAAVYVAGKPARLYAGIAPGSGLHFVPIPATPALLETYLPSTLSSADYPNLIPAGTEVETIAVGAVMAVYAWQPGTERYRKVARFVHAFTRRFDEFLRPPRHPKWREVNLAAQVPGWTRFDPGPPS
ncbi:TAXI family TRAP transporter solute-binding subunit [Elioraea tepidiphila]|jgi:TRAP transporter TAXI family solute receptor|uniref:TAXI family TRAP transporter solute-binding subunit n=1 Tax=Elioraea tepidiphila TaxID=457934 RepID=UPI000370EEEC|nr:TAXI family TRAP transporter solute-binding subunit [Elioraea tepidiphila]